MFFGMRAWTPRTMSTTWVTRKLTIMHRQHCYSLRLTMLHRAESDVGIDFHEADAGIGAEDVRHLPVLSRDRIE